MSKTKNSQLRASKKYRERNKKANKRSFRRDVAPEVFRKLTDFYNQIMKETTNYKG